MSVLYKYIEQVDPEDLEFFERIKPRLEECKYCRSIKEINTTCKGCGKVR